MEDVSLMEVRVLAKYLLWQIYRRVLPEWRSEVDPVVPSPSQSDEEALREVEPGHLECHQTLDIFRQLLAGDIDRWQKDPP